VTRKTLFRDIHEGQKFKDTLPRGARDKFNEYRRSAESRGLVFNLTLEQFESFWGKPCSYCGSQIITIGLDRVDNKKGYTLENITPCCWPCNRLKRGFSRSEFIEQRTKIAIHSGNR
jgi:hypothetical protein